MSGLPNAAFTKFITANGVQIDVSGKFNATSGVQNRAIREFITASGKFNASSGQFIAANGEFIPVSTLQNTAIGKFKAAHAKFMTVTEKFIAAISL